MALVIVKNDEQFGYVTIMPVERYLAHLQDMQALIETELAVNPHPYFVLTTGSYRGALFGYDDVEAMPEAIRPYAEHLLKAYEEG
jgi:hypothetical protein